MPENPTPTPPEHRQIDRNAAADLEACERAGHGEGPYVWPPWMVKTARTALPYWIRRAAEAEAEAARLQAELRRLTVRPTGAPWEG